MINIIGIGMVHRILKRILKQVPPGNPPKAEATKLPSGNFWRNNMADGPE